MTSKLKSFILIILLFVLFNKVGAQVPPNPDRIMNNNQDISALAGKWYYQKNLQNVPSTSRVPEIDFDIMQFLLSGSTGCNRMSGSFTADKKALHISDKLITTRMYCPDYDEMNFLKNLLKTDGYHFDRGSLVMTSGDSVISIWSRKMSSQNKPE
ncbi:MAG TPA: META domain-containing protein [Puia sp.]|nr:META domain-containing protein [Puia sp.]